MASNDNEVRTFETRLKFIGSLFNDLYSKDKIMTSCIQYKLTNSYEEYVRDIHKSMWKLVQKNPVAVLKRIDF